MRKIPTIFVRNPEDMRYVTRDINPVCQWVFDSETAVATRKYDGTCLMLDDDARWWARREVKPGKPEPSGWLLADVDEVTGKRMGWVPIEPGWQFFAMFREAIEHGTSYFRSGTYELCGPKINGNPEGYERHMLIRHAEAEIVSMPRALTYEWFAKRLPRLGYEGIVWHAPDGRMAKLKARDFPR